MPIDSSIYSRLRPVDVAGNVEGGLRMRDLIDQRNERQRKLAEEQTVQDAYSKNYVVGENGQGSFNQQKFMSDLEGSGKVRPETILGYKSKLREEQEAQQKAKRDQTEYEVGMFARIAPSIKDQQSYEKALSWLNERGIDNSKAPRAYDKSYIDAMTRFALSYKEQLDQINKQKELDLKGRELNAKYSDSGDFAGGAGGVGGGRGKGKAPAGYRFKSDGSLEPIPGGPEAGKKQLRDETQGRYSGIAIQDANRALNQLNKSPMAAGPIAGQTVIVPGTPAFQLNQYLDTLKASASFDRLQAMREASPTGGALGSVSENELRLLQSSMGSLDVRQNPEILRENIKRFVNITNDIVHGQGQGPKRYNLSFDEQGKQTRPMNSFTPRSRGVKPSEAPAQQGQVLSSRNKRQSQTDNQMVPVIAPDGRMKLIPQSEVQAALSAGGRKAEQRVSGGE
jgi:hypothetical protein